MNDGVYRNLPAGKCELCFSKSWRALITGIVINIVVANLIWATILIIING